MYPITSGVNFWRETAVMCRRFLEKFRSPSFALIILHNRKLLKRVLEWKAGLYFLVGIMGKIIISEWVETEKVHITCMVPHLPGTDKSSPAIYDLLTKQFWPWKYLGRQPQWVPWFNIHPLIENAGSHAIGNLQAYTAAQAQDFIICCVCFKPNVIYSHWIIQASKKHRDL